MLVARPYGDVDRFDAATRRLLAGLHSSSDRARHSAVDRDQASGQVRRLRGGQEADDVADLPRGRRSVPAGWPRFGTAVAPRRTPRSGARWRPGRGATALTVIASGPSSLESVFR